MNTPHSKSSLHILTLLSLLVSLIGGVVFVTPAQAAGIVVNSLLATIASDGECTLREAIQNANNDLATNADCWAGSGADTITFSVSGMITLGSTLPNITDAAGLTMDGTGQTVTISGNDLVRVLIVYSGASLTLNNLTIAKGKEAVSGGGGIYSGGTLNVTNSTFSGNSNGAIYSNGPLNVTNSTFSGNSGQGIISHGTLNILNSTFSGNTVSNNSGGGVYLDGWPDPITVTITNSTFSGNSAAYSGGGVFANNATLTIQNSTFSGNSASGSGGGIMNYNNSSVVTLRNTIVANSTGGNCVGTITNGGNNIDDGATCGWVSASDSMSSTDPLLDSLADNGGPTQTFELLTGSPAIDGVTFNAPNSAPLTDQRGVIRPEGVRYDIGSYEADTTPPNTTIDSTPPNPSNDNSPTFTFSGNDGTGSGIASFMCQMDSGGYSACATPSALLDGSHTFQVYAIDNVGNADASPASYTWIIETTEPNTTIDSNPPDPSNDNTPTFAFSGNDGVGSGIASFMCRMDGGGYSACSTPFTSSALLDGSHTFHVYAIDNAGNADASPASFTWQVDTTPPNTTIDSNPSDPSNDNTPTFTFSGNDGTGSGIASLMCQMDSGGYSACSSPFTSSALDDGPHTFDVYGIDMFGNADASPASHTWTLDTVAPDTTIINKPASPDNDSTPTFTFSGNDGAGCGIASFMCQMDGGSYSACATPFTSPALLMNVSHTFYVYAIDNAGNVDASPASFTWQVMRLYRIYLPLIMH